MTDPTNLPRLYGEKEIGKILKRATELQHDEPPAPSSDRMTLQELEEVAAEAGIDPAFLRRAALEIDSGAAEGSTWAKLAGEELVLVREITVPGELREDGFERIVAVLERGTSEHGQVNLLGKTLTWRAESNKSRTIQVTVASRDGQTSVRLEENLKKLASEYFGVFGGGAGTVGFAIGANVGIGLLGALSSGVGLLGLAYLGTRQVYRAIVRRRRRAMGQLFDQVLNEVGACLVDEALPSVARPPELTGG